MTLRLRATLLGLLLFACICMGAHARGGGGGGHGGGHMGGSHRHHTTYYYFAQTTSVTGHCVRAIAKVGDTVKLPNGSQATVSALAGPASYCQNPDFPIGAVLGQISAPSCGLATPFDPKAGIDLPDGWAPVKPSCALHAAQKGIFFYATDPTIEAGLVMANIPHPAGKSMREYVNERFAGQLDKLLDARPTGIEELQINGMPAWRFAVQGFIARSNKDMTYLITVIDRGPDLMYLNTYIATHLYSDHLEELDNLAYDIDGIDPAIAPHVQTVQDAR